MGIMGPVDTSYVSEHTKFINEQLKKNPEWEADQRRGRAIWWDKPQTEEAKKVAEAADVKAKAYPYDVHF
ncbi:MAG TPA: DUF3460 family protein [Rhodocyclaceae bacterium]